jgi:hypothetical protein
VSLLVLDFNTLAFVHWDRLSDHIFGEKDPCQHRMTIWFPGKIGMFPSSENPHNVNVNSGHTISCDGSVNGALLGMNSQ